METISKITELKIMEDLEIIKHGKDDKWLVDTYYIKCSDDNIKHEINDYLLRYCFLHNGTDKRKPSTFLFDIRNSQILEFMDKDKNFPDELSAFFEKLYFSGSNFTVLKVVRVMNDNHIDKYIMEGGC